MNRLPALKAFPLAMIAVLGGCAERAPEAPKLKIDPARVTVSGLSSGAYMAEQVHLALSDRIAGAGLLAGGPYGCARGDLNTALKHCMMPADGGPDAVALAEVARERAQKGELAPLSGLVGDRVWVFHGTQDKIVSESVSAASASIYTLLDPSVLPASEFTRATAHLFPTLNDGVDCAEGGSPYLGKCDYDAAGVMFQALYGPLTEPAPTAQGKVETFDQGKYAPADADAELADSGYIYVPPACAKETCGLHLAFHGCEQSMDKIGPVFAEQAGLNRWADAARVVVVYPQVEPSMMPLNPKGCWDWWGYTGPQYDTRAGAQIRFVSALIDDLTAAH